MSPFAQFLFNTVNDSNRAFLGANPTEFKKYSDAELQSLLGEVLEGEPPFAPTQSDLDRMHEEDVFRRAHQPRRAGPHEI